MLGLRGTKIHIRVGPNYFRVNPTYTTTVYQRHGRTDRWTDGQLTIADEQLPHISKLLTMAWYAYYL